MAQVKIIETPKSYYSKIESKRDVGIDIVKSIAILSVVGVHFFLNTRFYRVELDNFNLFIQTIIQQICLICIPLFVMSTGYLNNSISIDKKYFKKLLPIIYLYLLYSIPALIYRYQIGEIPFDIPMWIGQVLDFKGNRYSWYINLYIGLFLLIPFLNRMYNSIETKKEKQILIGILTILTCATTIRALHLPNYWSSIYPFTYYFIGKYIKEFTPRLNISKNILLLILVILVQGIAEYVAAGQGEYRHILTDYSSIFRLIEAYLLFILVYKLDIKNITLKNLVIDISKLTLDIYLVSFITDRLTYRVLKPYNIPQECYIYLMIPLVFVSFIFAYATAKLRARYIKIR
ncbi:MAG: acyltransferase [Peptostreptococcaceae bacterium]